MTQQAVLVSHIKPRESLDFKFDGDIPRFWFGGDAYKTRMVDGFQLAFPEGERYFITSVRHYRDQVADPQQLEDIRCFIRQGVFSAMLLNLLAYYKPSFHPEQQPVVHNYPAWIRVYDESGDVLKSGEAFYQAAHG